MKEKFNIAESGTLFIFALFAMSLVSVLLGFFPQAFIGEGLAF